MITYDEFKTWYEGHSREILEPARENARNALIALLRENLNERALARVQVQEGRVKPVQRAWQKLNRDKYRDNVDVCADIPGILDDLVGIRIICTNQRDVESVKRIIDAYEPATTAPVLEFFPTSERDYVSDPKASGYRAYHINLGAAVQAGLKHEVVTVELQVRTLLQDAWGELTHEDTYKPGFIAPALVEVLSLRMAQLLATLDDIAEDLRNELDRIDTDVVLDSEGDPSAALKKTEPESLSAGAEAARSYVQNQWSRLDRPIDFASLAWEIRRDFGSEVGEDWFGFDSFKALLTDAIDESFIIPDGPGYLFPSTASRADIDSRKGIRSQADRTVAATENPAAVHEFRSIRSEFPMLTRAEWKVLYGSIEAAMREKLSEAQIVHRHTVPVLTKAARDISTKLSVPVPRKAINYVATTLAEHALLETDMTAQQIADAFAAESITAIARSEITRLEVGWESTVTNQLNPF